MSGFRLDFLLFECLEDHLRSEKEVAAGGWVQLLVCDWCWIGFAICRSGDVDIYGAMFLPI
eukprot:7385112-Pyramimonas_sp.AAC.1